jgi:hypothetical protein
MKIIFAHKTFVFVSLMLALVLLPGCKEIGEGLSKVVFIEYDRSPNFEEYELGETIYAPPDSGYGWKHIRLSDHTGGEKTKRGVWITYQVCAIRNNAPKAQPFNYEVSKFFVEYGGKKHFYRPLAPFTYESVSPVVGMTGGPTETAILAEPFRKETQSGPDQQTIPPNSNNTLSVSWRFVIYVDMVADGSTDMLGLNLRLYYDDTPVNMVDRNNDSFTINGLPVRRDMLPTSCRPPRK